MTGWKQMTTAQRIEAMKPLTADGFSGGQIAKELGTTRNAVIGMWHRHGKHFTFPKREARILHRDRPQKPAPLPKREPIRKRLVAALTSAEVPEPVNKPEVSAVVHLPPVPRPVIVAPLPPAGPGISILDRQSHQCAWIMPGEQDGLALCCGEHTWRPGSAWCAYHARRVYVQPGDAPGKKSPERVAPTFLEAAE